MVTTIIEILFTTVNKMWGIYGFPLCTPPALGLRVDAAKYFRKSRAENNSRKHRRIIK